MSEPAFTSDSVAANLAATLNNHGHGFHHAVARRIATLHSDNKSAWRVAAVELPVVAGGRDYHIDIVLESYGGTCYAAVECKRVNPARSLWAFVKARAITSPGSTTDLAIFEKLSLTTARELKRSSIEAMTDSKVYGLGLALKSGSKGDTEGGISSQAIDDASAQSLRGVAGLANHFIERRLEFSERNWRNPVLVPLVITTANLWVSETDLDQTDLFTGEINPSKLKPATAEFLWYTTNQSRSVGLQLPFSDPVNGFKNWIKQNSSRAVGILNVTGIDRFLTKDIPSWLSDY